MTGMDPRAKIAFVAAALLVNLLSTSISAPLAIAMFCLVSLLAIGVAPTLLATRLVMPIVMAVLVLSTQLLLYGATPIFEISLWGRHLVGYEEGLARGFLILLRVLAGVSLITFLSLSTSTSRLLTAASWFRLPRIVIELMMLVYRYVFVLAEEAGTIRDAQKARLGYLGWRRSMHSLGVLGGSLVLRAYDRAGRVFEAMSARGYCGSMPAGQQEPFGLKGSLTCACLGAILAVFYFIGQLGA